MTREILLAIGWVVVKVVLCVVAILGRGDNVRRGRRASGSMDAHENAALILLTK